MARRAFAPQCLNGLVFFHGFPAALSCSMLSWLTHLLCWLCLFYLAFDVDLDSLCQKTVCVTLDPFWPGSSCNTFALKVEVKAKSGSLIAEWRCSNWGTLMTGFGSWRYSHEYCSDVDMSQGLGTKFRYSMPCSTPSHFGDFFDFFRVFPCFSFSALKVLKVCGQMSAARMEDLRTDLGRPDGP